MAEAATYDHIVIGAGSAGCVVANRLSADPDRTVLLIEAGGKDRHPLVRLPMLMGKLMHSGIYNWRYHTEPEPEFDNREVYWPRGKALGGTSTINGMIYVRGNRADYDRWAQMGNPGWSYAEVLPYFRKSESHVERHDAYHGDDGPLTVCRARGHSPLYDRFIEAGVEAGYTSNDDFNGEVQDGFGRYDFTIRDGKRWSTSRAFLRPVMNRPNLTVATHALTHRIVIEKGRAVGVEYERSGKTIVARATREIVLSAGAVNAPQILMLSGIGDADQLKQHGIAPVHHLPGVGRNLQDHVDVCVVYEINQPLTLYSDLRVDRLTKAIVEGTLFGRGVATTFPYEGGAFVRSRPGLAAPDIQAHFMPALEKTANLHWPKPFQRARVEDNHGVTIRVGPVNPESRGRITLRSADPRDPPRIFANYLATQFDKDTTIAGVQIIREVMAQPAFADILGEEIAPGPDKVSDADLMQWLKKAGGTTLHPVGTCKMGNDAEAVVDPELKVHGIDGLRVADASIMPIIASGNTNAPTIMIGEKAADMVLKATR
ncbi:GMC family oxidoreductase [Bauldia litoralis]|uniref:Choline dehydrogenase n=2 Tax=Bauldia litoralis TaxID=665467 RepID=A0A1G6BP57_9HYPH|nr:choline dehydrogenase [Bauldia litoralis]SDB22432.1 choline dehydrogenase [Bauldia litoralis]